jgi:nitric oxide reductase subunit B
MQTWASVEHGMWFARSADFLQSPLLEQRRWLRIIGDAVFMSGVAALAWFTLGLWTGWSFQRETIAVRATRPQAA